MTLIAHDRRAARPPASDAAARELDRLVALMTGDEKHSAAATSTLDVLRVLYERVLDIGPLLVSVGAGMALSGIRPIVHTFGSFLAERASEQVKLGFGHQDADGVLVGAGGSFDIVGGGRHYLRVVGQSNAPSYDVRPALHVVRRGTGPTVVAVGPVLDAVLAPTEGLDAAGLRRSVTRFLDRSAA